MTVPLLKAIRCGYQLRSDFERARRSNLDPEGKGGEDLGSAIRAQQVCLGLEPDLDLAFDQVERWFTYFDLEDSARGINALNNLQDLDESFSLGRRRVLGIEEDQGSARAAAMSRIIHRGRVAIERGRPGIASKYARTAGRLQYRFNFRQADRSP